ncbi:hypothetical protein F5884DRAFT_40854 [Xylogone sp. PMI_703]|nr:hypothetical protein F5884DRAFT_40854 [Xylogone sp. PMI_703]
MEVATLRSQERNKRACNECRQQKLRCDVVKEPFSSCTRCRRFQLVCKIDPAFKRVDKRRIKHQQQQASQNVHLSSPGENDEVGLQSADPILHESYPIPSDGSPASQNASFTTFPTRPEDVSDAAGSPDQQLPTLPVTTEDSLPGSTDVARPPQLANEPSSWKLGGIILTTIEVHDLFKEYFTNYHPFLPFLDSSKPPGYYFKASRLLFWVIISVASRRYSADLTLFTSLSASVPQLLWSSLQSITRNYHDIKALCLLCTWPFPRSSSSRDPTFMLGGTMMHLAMQIGLHMPRHAQDFSQFKVELSNVDIQDRMITWTTCNIVYQTVSTSYGQPPIAFFTPLHDENYPVESVITPQLLYFLRIQKLNCRISSSLSLKPLPAVTEGDIDSVSQDTLDSIIQNINELELEIRNLKYSDIAMIYLRCTRLHFYLYTLVDVPPFSPTMINLESLFGACKDLLDSVSLSSNVPSHCTNYLFWTVLAAGFTIHKLLSSSFADYLDTASTKQLFTNAIRTIRGISVANNDLAGRLAEVLVQLRAKSHLATPCPNTQVPRLKVRSRMSVSVIFDSLWEWRNGFLATEKQNERVTSANNFTPANPWANPTGLESIPMSSLGTPRDFDLNDLVFDDFYPMNYILDNTADISNSELMS